MANPKSLPASPWRQASVEQMASVCRAAIKEEETSGEMKVGQDWMGWEGREGAGRVREAARAPTNPLFARLHAHARSSLAAPPRPYSGKNKHLPRASRRASAA